MKILSTLIACVIGVAAALSAQARSFEEIKKDGKIIIATEGQYPPYNYFQGSKLSGFEVELAEAIVKKWGLTLEWKALSFDALLAGLRNDRWDLVIAGHAITEDRAKAVSFTEPHFCGGGIIVSKNAPIQEGKDLAGKTVSVQTGTTFLDEVKKVPGVKDVKNFPQDTDARGAMISGRTDAWITDPAVARAALVANPAAGLKIGGMLFVERNAAAVAKGNKSLAGAFNTALQEMLADGSYAAISKKWFNEDIRCK
ncbi:ABC transporter substrate-binding protein [Piscinibacter sp.]|jgi:polar amino acid transport system substrate-binding protein|uniref:ABC transporter substrate-binding protein n=1 Tax=Piscinibacter sp. TaxID=1903157 RepID=UPI00355ACC7C